MDQTQILTGLTWNDAAYLLPEVTLVAMAILITLLDLAMPNKLSRGFIGWLSLAGVVLSLFFVVLQMLQMNPPDGSAGTDVVRLLGDSYRVDDLANILKITLLTATALIILMGIQSIKRDDAITDKGEVYTLLLPAVAGALMLASTADLVTLYVGLELLSISTYVLAGIRKRSVKSSEAAFKYIVLGGISSAFILFGMSYIYGVTGTTNFGGIGAALGPALADYEALIYLGFFFIIGGFAIKIAAAPFHAWAPDVYQGAPVPVTAFLAVVSKGAALAALLRLLFTTVLFQTAMFTGQGTSQFGPDMLFALKALAASAMIVGTTAALRQRNLKRLLALSGVANAGYLLVPIAVGMTPLHTSNISEFAFYFIAYVFMNIGAFAVLSVVGRSAGHDELKGYAGLYYRAPWTAAAMVILLLSLAGLPVSGGFFGKLFILLGAAGREDYWLAAIMIVTSVISYYFYFSIIRQMFLRTGDTGEPIRMPFSAGLTLWICAAATLALGLFPNPLMSWIQDIVSLPADLFILQ
ncbi:NADH:ubiquinone oxidoreductase subunit N [Paenibacillus darwinianus]|uniref:NADH-quinone oxidoreductase subunit N n=1 Tax=Paenibacillus darwinianus TaxID=1380763 RepID=A0A9W5S0J4_9BACL|nr:NADH-quinone oxidoreductase subunit N [Paenibacillus darwinianus]EXX87443.1 NADH:ubiquinone oxidoreductase subunit N [Paenibacillus darwinianus]EXX87451.1 NADH:ubiquinone oxidoreductase subunit N [Paenibacillus darwinianus]EXX88859.1 NADH:ubiquinone oxidoreductase subunit N [Paenibacillus darwinianus]